MAYGNRAARELVVISSNRMIALVRMLILDIGKMRALFSLSIIKADYDLMLARQDDALDWVALFREQVEEPPFHDYYYCAFESFDWKYFYD
jgi:hypothetical protein